MPAIARRLPAIVLGLLFAIATPAVVAGCSTCVEEPTPSRTFVGEMIRTDGRGVFFRPADDSASEDLRVRIEGRRDLLEVGQSYEVTAFERRVNGSPNGRLDDPAAYLDAANCAVPDETVTIRHADGRAIDISSSIFASALWVIGLPAVGIAAILAVLTYARRRVLVQRDGHIVEDFGDGHFPED